MHSRKGIVCDLFIIETRRLVISLFQARNLPMGKRKVSYFPIPDKIMQIDGKFRLLSKHPENKSRSLGWIIIKEDTLSRSQIIRKAISIAMKVPAAHASH